MRNIFITGISGYFGEKFVSFFENKPEVERIVGIDIKPPNRVHPKLKFIQHDVRKDVDHLLTENRIDCVIQAAYVLHPTHDNAEMEDININGTKNIFTASAKAGIKQILDCSSTTAYGFHKDNPEFLSEESELRGNNDFMYSKNKKELEFFMERFRRANPDVCLTVIRPCFVVGPGFDNPLARHLRKKIVFIGSETAPFQFIHEEDLAEIVYLLLARKVSGIFNLAADGTMTFDEMVRCLGNIPVKIPNRMLYFLNAVFWKMRLSFMTEFPSPCLNMMQYRWIASNDKIKNHLNYRFRYTTRQAFEDFARTA